MERDKNRSLEVPVSSSPQKQRPAKTFGLYLSSKRGFTVLKQLSRALSAGQISFVVGARDANVERDYFDDIAALCRDSGIAFFEKNCNIDSDYCVAVGWRTLITGAEASRLIVIHDSLLPKYRGFNPVVTTLIEGDTVLGATAFFAAEKYDEGDVIAQRSLTIGYPIKISEALDALADLIGELVCEVVELVADGRAVTVPQNHLAATYSVWRDESDYRIDWTKDAGWIKRFVDAVGFPYKGASSMITGGALVRIFDTVEEKDVLVHDRAHNIGKIIFLQDSLPVVICGSGLLKITRMVDEISRKELIPLKRFRIRFE